MLVRPNHKSSRCNTCAVGHKSSLAVMVIRHIWMLLSSLRWMLLTPSLSNDHLACHVRVVNVINKIRVH